METLDLPTETFVPEFTGFSDDPIRTRWSGLYGEIFLFPPLGEPKYWNQLPWLLTSLHGMQGAESIGLKHIVKPDCIEHAFHHPDMILAQHMHVEPMPEIIL